MHKIFAKPLFFGKKILFLPKCHSTNEEMARIAKNGREPEGFIIYTDHQINGKGQRGNMWVAEPEKNVLLSLLLRPTFLTASQQYFLGLVVALGVYETIGLYGSGLDIKLKWPNDVYVNDRKICGILIEASLRSERLEHAIVGVGLNLNQRGFGIQNATSLSLESGEEHNKGQFIDNLLSGIEKWYLKLKSFSTNEIIEEYYSHLLGFNEQRVFKDKEGIFEGTILGIDEVGRLKVRKDGLINTYGIKEVSFID